MSGERQVYSGGAYGTELKADTSRAGVVDDGSVAWPERIVQARRQWPQADVGDFEPVGRRGWRDKATGVEYRRADGCPLFGIGTDSTRDVVAFIVADGRLVFLERADVPEGTFVHHGPVISREIPSPGGQPAQEIH